MKNKIHLAIISLHISAVIYCLLSVGMPWLLIKIDGGETLRGSVATAYFTICLVLCLGLSTFIEVVVHAIKRRKRWGWFAGIVLFGLYVPSLFLPLGVLGLWGLLDRQSRGEFGFDIRS